MFSRASLDRTLLSPLRKLSIDSFVLRFSLSKLSRVFLSLGDVAFRNYDSWCFAFSGVLVALIVGVM